MKVVMINSSPHEHGCTYTALIEIAAELARQGVESEILHIGKEEIHGCIACGQCRKLGKCVFDDAVNRLAQKLAEADGLVFGTPVYYAGISGQLKSFMDRLFFSRGRSLAYKPAAAVVSARRGGCTATFDDVTKYFTINCMPVVSSNYWNEVHGSCADDVEKDLLRIQIGAGRESQIPGQTHALKAGIESPLGNRRITECVPDFRRKRFAAGQIDQLRRSAIYAIAEKKNLEIRRLTVSVHTGLADVGAAVGFQID